MFGKAKKKNCTGFFLVNALLRVSEYISEGRDGFLVDPDLNLLHTKRKHASRVRIVLLLIQDLLMFLNKN